MNKNILNGVLEEALIDNRTEQSAFERLHCALARAGAGFPLLFESNPKPFLKLINDWLDDTLDKDDHLRNKKVELNRQAMLRYKGSKHLDYSYLTLINSLANVAWDERYIEEAAAALVKIEEIAGTRTALSTLRTTFLPWNPHTYAPLHKRKATIQAIHDLKLETSWRFLILLLPGPGSEFVFSAPSPAYRKNGANKERKTTWEEIRESYDQIARLCADLVNDDVERWKELLHAMQYSRWDMLADRSYLHVLTFFADKYEAFDEHKRRLCLDVLREIVGSFGEDDRRGRNPGEELKKGYAEMLEEAEAIAPASDRLQYVFEALNRRMLREGLADNATNEEYEAYMETTQRRAVDAIYREEGAAGIAKVAVALKTPYNQGLLVKAFLSLIEDESIHIKKEDYFNFVLEYSGAKVPDDEKAINQLQQFTMILSSNLLVKYSGNWRDYLQKKAPTLAPETLSLLISEWPNNRETWAYAKKLGKDVERIYWENMEWPYAGRLPDAEAVEMVDNLLYYKRARRAVGAIARSPGKLKPEKIRKVIEDALTETDKPVYHDSHFPLNIARLLDNLAKDEQLRNEISEKKIADWQLAFYHMLPFEEKEGLLLERYLLKHPEYFADLLKLGFKKDNGEEKDRIYTYKERLQAQAVWFVFERTRAIPGQTWQDGEAVPEIDQHELLNWIETAIDIAGENRLNIAISQIGKILGAAPSEPETGVWPHPAIRSAIEYLYKSYPARFDDFLSSMVVGKANRRGVLSRKIGSGGELKREEAKKIEADVAALPPEAVGTRRLLEEWRRHTLRNADFFDEIDEEDRFR